MRKAFVHFLWKTLAAVFCAVLVAFVAIWNGWIGYMPDVEDLQNPSVVSRPRFIRQTQRSWEPGTLTRRTASSYLIQKFHHIWFTLWWQPRMSGFMNIRESTFSHWDAPSSNVGFWEERTQGGGLPSRSNWLNSSIQKRRGARWSECCKNPSNGSSP